MRQKTKISIYGQTDMGRVRTNNEDAFVAQTLWDDNTYLAIAIDGVGGYEGGEIAADIARRTIPEFLLASSNGERVELLKQAVTAANNAIFDAREADLEHGQMSCVLTAAIIDVEHRQISMAHVGDSRLYSFHDGVLKKLSHDHSLIGYREEIGDLSEEEAMHHPQRNVISRDVGSQKHKANDDDFIEAQVFPLMPNTTLLFCSDGLTDMITSSTIASILNQNEEVEEKTNALIRAALDAGGKDNVTVVLFEYQSSEPKMTSTENAMDKENKTTQTTTVKQDSMKDQLIHTPSRKTWPTVVCCLIIGLFVGAILVFFGMNGRTNKLKVKLEEQQKKYSDSLTFLNNEIYTLNTQFQHQLETVIQGNNAELQSKIDSIQGQNDKLKGQLKIVEKQRKQLENKVKQLQNELDSHQ